MKALSWISDWFSSVWYGTKETKADILKEQHYAAGWEYAVNIWNTSPPRIARELLIKKMGDVNTAYEIGIWDFLKARNGEK